MHSLRARPATALCLSSREAQLLPRYRHRCSLEWTARLAFGKGKASRRGPRGQVSGDKHETEAACDARSPSLEGLVAVVRLDARHEAVARLDELCDVRRELLALAKRAHIAGDLPRPCHPQHSKGALLDG